MSLSKLLNFSEKHFWFLSWSAFLICLCYWVYLIVVAKPVIAFDAIGYLKAGQIVHNEGWNRFFELGANREPVYVGLIALGEHLALHVFNIDHTIVQQSIQMLFLAAGFWILFYILRYLDIHPFITLITVFYFGVSPSVINSMLSFFSECVLLPLILLMVIIPARALQDEKKGKGLIVMGLALGLTFAAATLTKGVFQYVFYAVLFPFCVLLITTFSKSTKKILFFILGALFVFSLLVSSYRAAALKLNPDYELRKRAVHLLYGNTVKRANPLNGKIAASAIASIPGGGVCRLFFSDQDCLLHEFELADDLRSGPKTRDWNNFTEGERNEAMLQEVKRMVIAHPLNFVFFTVVEALKMPFWETTKLGFVDYPNWLAYVYNTPLINQGLRLIVSLLTYISLIFVIRELWQNKRSLREQKMFVLLIGILIFFSYTGIHALFTVVVRYSIPLIPVYLMFIAYFLNGLIHHVAEK